MAGGRTPVLIIQIDRIHSKSFERRGALLPDKSGVTAYSLGTYSEFGGQKDVAALSSALKPLADEFFRISVDVRAVPKQAALCMGRVQNLTLSISGKALESNNDRP
jgi:hypothetical protein